MKHNPATVVVMIYFGIIFLAIFSSLFETLGEEAIHNPFDYARITDLEYSAKLVDELGSNGKVVINEKITFDIHAASRNNLFWELWRDLPEDYIDGLKVDYKVNSVKQILEDGSELIYPESSKLYWEDEDYTTAGYAYGRGPGKWYHSPGPYNESYRRYECVFFYVNGLYREQPVFEIEYEMNNAALRYNDCSELYLCMYSEDTIKYLDSFKGEILIPTKDMPRDGNYYAHTYGTNSNEFEFSESSTKNPGFHTFSFELDKSDLKFSPYNEYIEFSLVSFGNDRHVFTEYAPANDYTKDNVLEELLEEQKEYESKPYEYAKTKFVILLICLVCSFLLVKKFLRADNEVENKYTFYTPTMDMDYFRDIPSNLDPLFASNLAFCRHKPKKEIQDGYAAIVLSLARKKYIELTKISEILDWSNSNTLVTIKDQPVVLHPDLKFVQADINEIESDAREEREPLTKTEELYLNLLKRHVSTLNHSISMSNLQSKISSDYDYTDSFVRNIEKSTVDIGISQGYFQKADFREPQRKLKSKSNSHLFIGILILVLFNFISYQTRLGFAFGGFSVLGVTYLFGAYIYRYLSKKYLLFTQFGEDEYMKWKGLYNFLNSETLMKERTVIELPIWEQYLVYATAFGISDKVIKALKIRCPEIVAESPILSNSYYRSHNFYHSHRSFRHSVRSTSSFARSGGYGGHGGYGGGGRGGGGGGGGH